MCNKLGPEPANQPAKHCRLQTLCMCFQNLWYCSDYLDTTPPSITNPLPDAESLIDRQRSLGYGSVVYPCEASGNPTPTITWYYNAAVIQSGSGGVVVGSDGTLTIQEPQVNHSGIYQCFARNRLGYDFRAWILEVREESKVFAVLNLACYRRLDLISTLEPVYLVTLRPTKRGR